MKAVPSVPFVISFLVGFAMGAGVAALAGLGPNELFAWWFSCSVSGAMAAAIFTGFYNAMFRESPADSEQEISCGQVSKE